MLKTHQTQAQSRAIQMDERLEAVAQMAKHEGWWSIARSIRDVREQVRQKMHIDDISATSPVA